MKSKILRRLLALLGFTTAAVACESTAPDEYGCPYASFELKGKVTDPAGTPIRNIRITADVLGNESTATTQNDGTYRIRTELDAKQDLTVSVVAVDTDGPENGGEFASQHRELTVRAEEFTGGNGWCIGNYAGTVNFDLQEKQHTEP